MAGVQLQRLAGTITQLALLIILLLGSSNPSFSSGAHPSSSHATTDTISVGRSLSGNQTIVSGGGQFELGFFTPGNSRRYYVGIWYKNIPVQTVIWVANRDAPLSSTASSELKLSPDGNLVLAITISPPKIPVWSSNITRRKLPGSTAVVAVLLDTGNLVLREAPRGSRSRQLWQSFDHPTDTWVPDMVFGMNKMTGEHQVLTSWKNSQDPAPGMYSHRLRLDGSNGYINVWNGSVVYDETGVWNGHAFDLVPQMNMNPNFGFRFVETREHKYMACTHCSRPVRMVMDFTGQMKISMWVDEFQKWQLIFVKPTDQCDVFSICGAFGVCDQRRNTPCSCLPGFDPMNSSGGWDLGDWSGGCVRRSPLQCAEDHVYFSLIPDVKLPTNPRIIILPAPSRGDHL